MKKSELKALWARLEGAMGNVEGDDADVPDEKIAAALQEKAHPVYQVVFNRGHSDATTRAESKLTEAQTAKDQAEQAAQKARDELKELQEQTPDLDKLKVQYDESVTALKNQHKSEMQELRETFNNERQDRTLAQLRATLVGRPYNVDPDYAEVLVAKPEVRSRVRFNDEGRLEVLQAGKDIPFASSDEGSPIGLLADELKKSVPAKFITSNADGGAGSGSDHGGGAGSSKLGDYRKRVEKEREEKREGNTKSAKERMGLTPAN